MKQPSDSTLSHPTSPPASMSLSLLPTEIQCSIVRLLDPVSLISISQASTHFRRLVSPSRRLLVDRLLALETILDHGGESPLFNPCENSLHPGPNDPEWSSIRWACTDCLRLLSDADFDDHSIITLAYRKPTAVSSVHELPPTTWEPEGANRLRRRAEGKGALLSDKKLRQRYLICVTAGSGTALQNVVPMFNRLDVLQDCGMEGFQGLTEEEFRGMSLQEKTEIFRRNAQSIENERAGYRRRLRACNECRYQRRKIQPQFPGYGGTARMPIVPSRQNMFGTVLDRWFPGFSDGLGNKRPGGNPVPFRVYRVDPREQPLSTYMARCPQCERWRELREFRIGGIDSHWKPAMATADEDASVLWDGRVITESLLDKASCNACFAAANGREELSRVLLQWINELIHVDLVLLNHKLSRGLFSWWGDTEAMPVRYRRVLKWIRRQTPCMHSDHGYMLTYSDVALLKLRQAQFKDILGGLPRDTGTDAVDKVGTCGDCQSADDEGDGKLHHTEREDWWVSDQGEGSHWSWILDTELSNKRLELEQDSRRESPTDSNQGDMSWLWMIGSMSGSGNAGRFGTCTLDRWYESWSAAFTEAEARWRWLMSARVELAERPEALAEWALKRS